MSRKKAALSDADAFLAEVGNRPGTGEDKCAACGHQFRNHGGDARCGAVDNGEPCDCPGFTLGR